MQAFDALDLRDVIAPEELGAQIAASCKKSRLTLVHANPAMAIRQEYWDEALGPYGERGAVDEESTSGRALAGVWSNVAFDPARQNRFRHSKSAQPLHTDGSYVRDPPPIVFLICRQPAPSGGATLFLDGVDLIDALERERPELLRQLESTPVLFSKGGVDVESLIIERVAGELFLRWNYYAVSDRNAAAVRVVADGFHDFLQRLVDRSTPRSLSLQQGDAVFFHDAQLLHGRESFTAHQAGDRRLWKGGVRFK